MKQQSPELANTIYRLGHIERILVDQALTPYQLRMNHARVLNYLHRHPGSTQKELAEFLDYQQASLTNLINHLEERQMLVRKVDPNNGRQKRLYLQAGGKQVLQKTDRIFDELNELVSDIDPQVDQILQEKVTYLRKTGQLK